MTAEKNTPMIVSEERALFRCTAMMPSPTRMPKTGMATCGLMEKIRPSATPAKAEWLMASEKGHAEADDLHAHGRRHRREQDQGDECLLHEPGLQALEGSRDTRR